MLAGFNNALHTSQQAFRAILKAMSEPATIVDITDTEAWENLNPASVGVLLTLCDQNTHVHFSAELESDNVIQGAQFHTQAVVGESQAAHFAFINANEFNVDAYNHGNEVYPEQSATVVIQVHSLTDGKALTLSGPGIENTESVSLAISDELLAYYQQQTNAYPLGIDTILTCGNQLLAIPRTTKVEAN